MKIHTGVYAVLNDLKVMNINIIISLPFHKCSPFAVHFISTTFTNGHLFHFAQMRDLLRLHCKIDIELLEKVVEVLKPFKDVTVFMSGQTVVTASLIKPLLTKLVLISKPTEDDSPPLHQAKATLYHDLEKR